MILGDQVLLAIIDKLLIGLFLLIVGLWLNAKLEKAKGEIAAQVEREKGQIMLQVQNAVNPFRSTAYAKLWALSEELSPRDRVDLTPQRRQELIEHLRDWYYKAGNAMYLSLDSADLFLRGLSALERLESTAAETKSKFSALRTQMKVDLGIYTPDDARVRIPKVA